MVTVTISFQDHVHIALFDVGFASASEPTVTWWNIRGETRKLSGPVVNVQIYDIKYASRDLLEFIISEYFD